MNIGVAYLPVTWQRKMLMGAHTPLAILAGLALNQILQWRSAAGLSRTRRLQALGLWGSVVVLGLTNLRFMARDMAGLPLNLGPVRSYLYAGEVNSLRWIRDHTPRNAPIQPLPWIAIGGGKLGFTDNSVACYAPGLTGHSVNAGHWGETPLFASTMLQWVRFMLPTTSDDQRRDLLRRTGVMYILYTQKHPGDSDAYTRDSALAAFEARRLPYLRPVPGASNADATVFQVVLP